MADLSPKRLSQVNALAELSDATLIPVQKDWKWARVTMGQLKERMKTVPEDLQDVVDEARGFRDTAESHMEGAEGYKDEAEQARDAILQAASFNGQSIFETVAAGMSGTSENDFFWVIPNETDETDYLTLWQNDDDEGRYVLTHFDLNEFLIEEGEVWNG